MKIEKTETNEAPEWIAEAVGFRATKGFRAARRAQRPVVGDRFRSVRDRGRMEVVVDAVDWQGMVLFRRFVEGKRHEEFCRADSSMWPHCVLGALRRGAEFIPANSQDHPPEGSA